MRTALRKPALPNLELEALRVVAVAAALGERGAREHAKHHASGLAPTRRISSPPSAQEFTARGINTAGSTHRLIQVGKLDRGQTYAPKISRRYAPGNFTRNRVKGPNFFGATRRNPTNQAQNFPALRAGSPTTRFPHTY